MSSIKFNEIKNIWGAAESMLRLECISPKLLEPDVGNSTVGIIDD